jgi:hypothetical protein
LSKVDKCPETSAWRNYFLSLRAFGLKATLETMSCRYPRERLFNALALLLWNAEVAAQPRHLRRVQQQLRTNAPDWAGLVSVFKRILAFLWITMTCFGLRRPTMFPSTGEVRICLILT